MGAVAVVPAAGRAERFGGRKLIARLPTGELLIDRTLQSILSAGIDRIVVVASGSEEFAASALVTDVRVSVVTNPDPSRGMFSSIRAGLGVAQGDPILVLPGDMPFVSPATIARVIAACGREGRIIVPTFNGRRGHPVAFPAHVTEAILAAPAESTLKVALASAGVTEFELPVTDEGIVRDVDVVSDLGPND